MTLPERGEKTDILSELVQIDIDRKAGLSPSRNGPVSPGCQQPSCSHDSTFQHLVEQPEYRTSGYLSCALAHDIRERSGSSRETLRLVDIPQCGGGCLRMNRRAVFFCLLTIAIRPTAAGYRHCEFGLSPPYRG